MRTFWKAMILGLPAAIFLFLILANYAISHDFNHFYEIGGEQDLKKGYLGPPDRLTPINETTGSRNMSYSIVYFSVPVPDGSTYVNVTIAVKDNFPPASTLSIGAQNTSNGGYLNKKAYNNFMEQLNTYPHWQDGNTTIYKIRGKSSGLPLSALTSIDVDDYSDEENAITTALRGSHEFKIYIRESLELSVTKQDLNRYNDSDEMTINLLDSNGVIASTTIPDDGITDVAKGLAPRQTGILKVNNLKAGVYALQIKGGDLIIRDITINTNKIIARRLFLAGSEEYIEGSEKFSRLFSSPARPYNMSILTYHQSAYQNISLNNRTVAVDRINEPVLEEISGGTAIYSEKNDLILESDAYFSFSRNGYFEPVRIGNASGLTDIEKFDYIISVQDYEPVLREGDLLLMEADFETKDLFIKDNKLGFSILVPHLGSNTTKAYQIPIDWINITVHKNGIYQR